METNHQPKRHWFTTSWTKFRSRFKTKRPFSLTRPGWVFILYTVGVGAGAINTGNNLLYLIFGLFLGIILASGVLSDLSLWGLSANIVVPTYATAGHPLFIQVSIRNNKKWASSLSVRVVLEGTLEGKAVKTEIYVPALSARENYLGQLLLTPERRGLFRVQQVKFLTRFPFGLLTKWWVHLQNDDDSYQSIVFPSTYPLSRHLMHQLEEQPDFQYPIDRKGDGTTLRGIRPYDPTDNPRRIHWKASAKRSSLSQGSADWLVKELEAEGKEAAQINWPAASHLHSLSEAEFEDFVSFTASLTQALEQEQQSVSFHWLLDVKESWVIDNPTALMMFLALVKNAESSNDHLARFVHKDVSTKNGIDVLSAFRRYKDGRVQ